MKITISVTNVRETIDALQRAQQEVPDAIRVAVDAGLRLILKPMKEYPPQPPPMGKRPSRYLRTHLYERDITGPYITMHDRSIFGYINSGAPYSLYLRGNAENYDGAWMHIGVWESLSSILQRVLPQVKALISDQLDRLFRRLNLSE
jgi:hypothetical protein